MQLHDSLSRQTETEDMWNSKLNIWCYWSSIIQVHRKNRRWKWKPKLVTPFALKQVMGSVTYKIELPPSMKRAQNFFHVSRLQKFNWREDGKNSLSVVIDEEGTIEKELSAKLDTRRRNRKRRYLVQFQGDAEEDAISMNKSELSNFSEVIKTFEGLWRTTSSKRS